MGTFTPHRGTHHLISIQRGTTHPSHGHPHPTQGHTLFHLNPKRNDTPIKWAPSPHTAVHIISSQSREERHTHLMGILTPQRGTHRFISIQRGTTHPSHEHTQHMGSLTGRLNLVSEENVPSRMSHEAAIINN
jgi:hypothetical protein